MRDADTYTDGLFTHKKLDDFVPMNHPLRVIRTIVNKALAEMGELFTRMYEDDIKGGRPSIAPEKQLRATLLQVLYSIRCERQLMEQTQCTRWSFQGNGMCRYSATTCNSGRLTDEVFRQPAKTGRLHPSEAIAIILHADDEQATSRPGPCLPMRLRSAPVPLVAQMQSRTHAGRFRPYR